MSAYVIGDINVTNPETYAEYAAAVSYTHLTLPTKA